MNSLVSLVDGSTIAFESLTFPGGEPHVQFNPAAIDGNFLWIDARLGTASDFVQLLALADAVRACRPAWLGLFIPYFPGARQDRRQHGTALTVRVYADAIQRCGFDHILTLDPHSDVLGAVLPCEAIGSARAIDTDEYAGFICPDAGAEKRVYAAAEILQVPHIIHGSKHRDARTGKLSGFSCEPLPRAGRYLVVDDICDGGGTFIGLADALRRDPLHASCEFDLYVSHGIFSKGLEVLLGNYKTIRTTDSFPFTVKDDRLIVKPLRPIAHAIMQRRSR